MASKTDLDPMATFAGLAARFDRPPVHYPVRVLGFRGDTPPTYTNVEYKVQLQSAPGGPVDIRWMPVSEWRELSVVLG